MLKYFQHDIMNKMSTSVLSGYTSHLRLNIINILTNSIDDFTWK